MNICIYCALIFFVEQSEGMAQRILFLVGEIYSDVL